MHNDAYIGGRSENTIKCVLHDDLGRKNRTTRYNCRFSATSLALPSDFFQFRSCGTYSVLSRSPSVMCIMHMVQ